MLEHQVANECSLCDGTGVLRAKARGARVVIWTCSCVVGRQVAASTAGYAVVQAIGVIGKAFR